MKKAVAVILAGVLAISMFAGCGKKKTDTVSSAKPEVSVSTEEVEEVNPHAGEVRSDLTGKWIKEKYADKRPLAVMTGNSRGSLPQYGISDASIIYESPVEGGETRLMAVYSYPKYKNAKKIMSIRSCRHYYIDWALEFDALYAHFGQAKYAKEMLSRDYVNNLNGLEGAVEAVMYQRDSSRRAPHNAYTTGEGIVAGIEKKEYTTTHSDEYQGHYQFNEDDEHEIELTDGEAAVVVKTGYPVNKPWFVYDSEKGVYNRFQYGDKQIDANNDKQLQVKNILLQVCDWEVIDQKYGYLDVDTTSGGEGMYITNGKAIPVTWSKESQTAPTRYFDKNGKEITLNQGKTWVCIIQDTYVDKITLFASEEEFSAAE